MPEQEEQQNVEEQQEPTQEIQADLNEQDAISMISDLLQESKPEPEDKPVEQEEPKQEVKEEKPEETEKEKEQPESKPEISIPIDDALIEQFPTLRGLRGKDLVKDLPKHYTEAAKELSRQGQELARLRKENESLKKPEPQNTQVQSEEDLLPDPIDNEKEFVKAVEERAMRKAEAKAEEKFNQLMADFQKNLPHKQEEQAVTAVTILQSKLPKDLDANKVIDDYAKDFPELFFDFYGNVKQDFIENIKKNPHFFAHTVLSHYEAKEAKIKAEKLEKERLELEKNQKKEVKKKAYEHTKKNFQEAQLRQPEGSEVNLYNRQEPELNNEEKLYLEILKNEQNL